jgi:hypothetical protein
MKRKMFIGLALLMISTLPCCETQPTEPVVPQYYTHYFPLNKGNNWTYSVHHHWLNGDLTYSANYLCEGLEKPVHKIMESGDNWRMINTGLPEEETIDFKHDLLNNSNGCFVRYDNGHWFLISDSMNVGDTSPGFFNGSYGGEIDYEFVEYVDYQVPAGSFSNVMKFYCHSSRYWEYFHEEYTAVEYYAPDVGLIYSHYERSGWSGGGDGYPSSPFSEHLTVELTDYHINPR